MANLYSKLGSTASKAITSQGAGEAGYAQMDYIDRMYDIKRQRLEKLFSTLGSGWEAVERYKDVKAKNNQIKDMFTALGYRVDTGFLGAGEPKIYKSKPDFEGGWTEKSRGESKEFGVETEIIPDKFKEEEVSMFDAMMKSDFSIGDIFNLFKSKNGRVF